MRFLDQGLYVVLILLVQISSHNPRDLGLLALVPLERTRRAVAVDVLAVLLVLDLHDLPPPLELIFGDGFEAHEGVPRLLVLHRHELLHEPVLADADLRAVAASEAGRRLVV